jgi:hypothetical protein
MGDKCPEPDVSGDSGGWLDSLEKIGILAEGDKKKRKHWYDFLKEEDQ